MGILHENLKRNFSETFQTFHYKNNQWLLKNIFLMSIHQTIIRAEITCKEILY